VKVAVITDDGRTISQHFGRAPFFLVATVEDGRVLSTEMRQKAGHHTFAQTNEPHHGQAGQHGFDPASQGRHVAMLAAIQDCQVVLAGGMGQGMLVQLQAAGIRPVLTEIQDIHEALRALIDGSLVDRSERAH
jgi:predicted Fe-Mo cluster-binding NifX family protein